MERRTCLLGGQLLQSSAKRLSYWPTASGTLQQSLYTARAAACISLPSVPSSFLTDKLVGRVGGERGREWHFDLSPGSIVEHLQLLCSCSPVRAARDFSLIRGLLTCPIVNNCLCL